jgi:hypothetical protein
MAGRFTGRDAMSGTHFVNPRGLEGFDELIQKFDEIEKWGHSKDRQKVKAIHKKVAAIARKAIKRHITNHPKTIRVRRTGRLGGKRGPDYDILPGTLKKSIKVFDAMGSKTSVIVGPRSGVIDRTKSGPAAGTIKDDGYFAHMIHDGDLPEHMGGRGAYTGPNRNFYDRAMTPAVFSHMTSELVKLYRAAFDKFMDRQ